MRLVDVYCEACGKPWAVTPGAKARHLLCPLRRIGYRAPRYLPQTGDDPEGADGSGTRTRPDHAPTIPSGRVRSST